MGDRRASLAEERDGRLVPGGRPEMGVYATAAALATAVPVPVVDEILGRLARGAAMRRVAHRHGVRLVGDARAVLARGTSPGKRRSLSLGLLRRAVSRLVAPLRIASRLDDALETLAASLLLDHYLASADRPAGAPLGSDEARRVRLAMDAATTAGPLDSLRDAPGGLWRTIVTAVRAAATPDVEDRSPVERLVDALLDAAADAPGEVGEDLRAAFDAALSDAPGGREAGAPRAEAGR